MSHQCVAGEDPGRRPEDEVGPVADSKAVGDIEAASSQRVNFRQERSWIDDHARADDRLDVLVKDPCRKQVEGEFLAINPDRMAGVGSTIESNDAIKSGAKKVHHLPFSFIAPPQAKNACMAGTVLGG